VLDFTLLRDKAALINNKSNSHIYVNYYQDRWFVTHRNDALNLKSVIDQHYGEKRWPKRFTLPLSALTMLRACDSKIFNIEDKQLSELFHLESTQRTLLATLPKGLNATLRDYQVKGLAWIQFLEKHGLGGILADDMGLGKTIQLLSFLLYQKETKRHQFPSLIVCPTSLLDNWLSEASRFTPDLKFVVVQGADRQKLLARTATADVVLTSFPLLMRDQDHYLNMHFSNIILDEAQTIKNYQSKVSRLTKSLKGNFHLCLSGTPVENNLSELKSLFDFAMPGLLGSTVYFKNHFQQPIEKDHNTYRAEQLNDIIAGYVLRRTKAEVAKELPAKTEMVKLIELSEKQNTQYRSISEQIESKVKSIFEAGEQQTSKLLFLESLLKLRQVCCDLRLLDKSNEADSAENSAKLNYLTQTLPEMLNEGRKVIIFSQFTSMLKLIEQKLTQIDIDYSILTGQTRQRQKAIDKFQQGSVSVFLISLKAGGTGLNLTAADTVIHYDPWWNPAVERQATDRAYRIGQDKPVFVYKLICKGTIEEKVQHMQEQKAALAERFFDNSNQGFSDMNEQDLINLIGS
jgi:SNF2 family DNA or RNA helicase